jgi:hypothetical protein
MLMRVTDFRDDLLKAADAAAARRRAAEAEAAEASRRTAEATAAAERVAAAARAISDSFAKQFVQVARSKGVATRALTTSQGFLGQGWVLRPFAEDNGYSYPPRHTPGVMLLEDLRTFEFDHGGASWGPRLYARGLELTAPFAEDQSLLLAGAEINFIDSP